MGVFKILRNLIPSIIELVIAPLLLPLVLRNKARAEVIETVALAVASHLLVEFPTQEWAALVELAVRRLAEALPPDARTSNTDVLKRAVIGALLKAGAKPHVG